MDEVTLDGKGGAGDVVVGQIGQQGLVFSTPVWLAARDRPAGGPRLPDTQEPKPVETAGGEAVKVVVGNIVQGRGPAQGNGKLAEPDTGVDLIKGGETGMGHR